ncbi:MarR family transcriptional regulator [Haloarchaeobius sp. DT45]|uniref:MarR family transcriptional regulator n=1 Tax=Haloarchaeobius sp. DT45 TaxID=3446116 RepID=UPI003F6A5628
MALVDDRVLEYIHDHEHGSPTEMMEEGPIRYSRQYIAKRCKELAKRGLLTHVGNGVYVITDKGEAYLAGEYDTSEDALNELPNNGNGDISASEEAN